MGKILLSSFMGLFLLGACAQETAPTPGRPGGRGTTGSSIRPGGSSSLGARGGAGSSSLSKPGSVPGQVAGVIPVAGAGSQDNGDTCGQGMLNNPRVTPVVWLVIDGSGSMAEPFGDITRWEALRTALMDPVGGVVPSLESQVKFGMVMYDGPLPGGGMMTLPDGGPATGAPPTEECPRIATVEPALMNFAAIEAMYPTLAPGGSTPTDKALAQVQSHLPQTLPAPDSVEDPVYVVLATDGAPNDFCSMGGGGFFGGGDPNAPANNVIAITQAIAGVGIPTYVISLAAGDAMLAAHLDQVAAAGATTLPPFTPMNKEALVQTFSDIIGPEVFCEIPVRGFGIMESVACAGTVMLNGEKLDCGDNGWRLKNPNLIEITGTACDKFRMENNARVTANFPCEVIIPQ